MDKNQKTLDKMIMQKRATWLLHPLNTSRPLNASNLTIRIDPEAVNNNTTHLEALEHCRQERMVQHCEDLSLREHALHLVVLKHFLLVVDLTSAQTLCEQYQSDFNHRYKIMLSIRGNA